MSSGQARPALRLASPSVGASFKPKDRLGGGGRGGAANGERMEQLNKSGEVSLKRRWTADEVENLKAGVAK